MLVKLKVEARRSEAQNKNAPLRQRLPLLSALMSSRSVGGGKKTSCYWDERLQEEPSAEREKVGLDLKAWMQIERNAAPRPTL